MKRLVAVMAATMLTVACLVTTAFAAGSTISVSSIDDAKKGDVVSVDVSIAGNPGLGAYDLELTYDSSALKLQSISEGSLTQGKGMFSPNPAANWASFMSLTDIDGDGQLLTAKFEVVGDKGDYSVGVNVSSIGNGNGSFSATVNPGNVNVACTHNFAGDFTGDASGHWQTCSCGEKGAVSAHEGEWSVTKEATETEKGSKTRTCSVCGYVETAEIPVVTPDNPKDPADPDTPVVPDEDPTDEPKKDDTTKADDKIAQTGDSVNMIAMVVMMAVAVAAVAASVVVGKKKGFFQKP